MSLLEELNGCLGELGISIETGVFSDTPPEEYLVITPLADSFALPADNTPLYEIQEARLSFFKKSGYTKQKKPNRPRPLGRGDHHTRPPVHRA